MTSRHIGAKQNQGFVEISLILSNLFQDAVLILITVLNPREK